MQMLNEELKPSAKVILDSITREGHRLTTIEATMHRFVLAELNTHRVFSRNSASSRAIKAETMRNKAMMTPAVPVYWGSEKAGMQAGDELTPDLILEAKALWFGARNYMVNFHEDLCKVGLHKQITNRIIEPWMWHTVIITATEWDNFFWQRCDADAQPEMKAVADQIQLAYYTSRPKELGADQWHLPYIDEEDYVPISEWSDHTQETYIEVAQQVSVARCARVSYLTHDGKRSIKKDVELYHKLTQGNHWSPFEHVGTPALFIGEEKRRTGNFQGWMQFRKLFPNENRGKFIPNLPELWAAAERIRRTL